MVTSWKDPSHSSDLAQLGVHGVYQEAAVASWPTPHVVSQEFGWSVELGQKSQVERKLQNSLVTPAPLEFTADSPEE